MTPRTAVALATLIPALAVGAAARGEELPSWVQAAAAIPTPTYGKTVHAVGLAMEATLTVSPDGSATRTVRRVVRILDRDGAASATASAAYEGEASKVRMLRAWLIRPGEVVRTYGGKETLDVARAQNDVYSEARAKVINARDNVVPGTVFAYEAIVELHRLFASDIWNFQGHAPVLSSRCVVSLPTGWTAEGVLFNHAAVTPEVTGSRYVWELRDLPPIEDEVASPPLTSLAPRLYLRFLAPAGAAALAGGTFDDGTSVSKWMTALAEPQTAADEALTANAHDLVKDAQDDWQRIAAVARFVQSTGNIAIEIGLGRYRPHAATEVLAKSYGDSKDQANLMLALLKVLGLRAHLLLTHAVDPTYVRTEWPSPQQFDHCVLAIQLHSPTAAGAVIEHERLGRLLIFDPSDPHTSLGDLPYADQGGWGLLVAGPDGGLVRLPLLPPSDSRVERKLEVVLRSGGGIEGELHESAWGQSARSERAAWKGPAGTYTRHVEDWLAAGVGGARATNIETKDNPDDGRFDLTVRFAATSSGQTLQNRLLLFRPVLVPRRDSLRLTEATRTQPIRIEASEFRETTRIALPAGFAIDELPQSLTIESQFGRYALTLEGQGDQISVVRQMTLQRALVPAAEYKAVRQFFEKIAAAEQSRVVLVRQ